MMTSATQAQGDPKIQRGRVDSITIYEVTESELTKLEAGTPTGYLFDLFLALVVLGVSFILTLTTTTITSDRLHSFYSLLVLAALIGAAICFCIWLKCRKSLSMTIKQIKKRVQPPATENPDPNAKG